MNNALFIYHGRAARTQTGNPAAVSYSGVTYPDCLSIQGKSSFSNNCQAKGLDQLPAYLPGRKFRDFMPV